MSIDDPAIGSFMSGRWFWCARTAMSPGVATTHPLILSKSSTTSAEQVRPRSTDKTYALVVSCKGHAR